MKDSLKAQQDGDDQATVAKVIAQQNDAVQGQASRSAGAGQGQSGKFPELQEPHLVLASQAGIAATTPQSLHLQAGEHIAISSQGHTSWSVGKRWLVSAKHGIRLFALKNGMKWIAGHDKVQIEAHKDKIHAKARQAVRITSTEGSIYITAPKKVVFNGGGSFTEWRNGSILHGTPGTWVEHAAYHFKVGPAKLPTEPQNFAACAMQEKTAVNEGAAFLPRESEGVVV